MVEVVFESARARVTGTMPQDAGTAMDGRTAVGEAWLIVRTFAPGEVIPKAHDHARPVASIVERLRLGEPFVSSPPRVFVGETLRDVVVPRSMLDAVPADAMVAIDWEFKEAS